MRRALRRLTVAAVCAVAAIASTVVLASPARAAGPRPLFQLPFACGQQWTAQTRSDHIPNPNSLDFSKVGGGTLGQPILAAYGGTVVRASYEVDGNGVGAGWYVRIDHGQGWQTRYLHMNGQPAVSVGQRVERGQRIGDVGYSGVSPNRPANAHLHFEQMQDDTTVRSLFNGAPVTVEVGRPQTLTSHNCGGAARDFNGDGRTDQVLYQPSSGSWLIRNIGVDTWGHGGSYLPVIADFDNDASVDRGLFQPSTGQWLVRDVGLIDTWGGPGDVPLAADFTGDGRTDLALFRPSTGQWWVRNVGLIDTWGDGSYVPIVGDFDNNGRVEYGLFQPATGQWWVRNVGLIDTWGGPGDTPLVGDYNGDGRTDLALFRPSTGQWWVRNVGLIDTWGDGSYLAR